MFKGFTCSKRECFLFDFDKKTPPPFPVNLNNLPDFGAEDHKTLFSVVEMWYLLEDTPLPIPHPVTNCRGRCV